MAANFTLIPQEAILNPYTPLAFLSPAIASQYEIVGYVYVATLAVSGTVFHNDNLRLFMR